MQVNVPGTLIAAWQLDQELGSPYADAQALVECQLAQDLGQQLKARNQREWARVRRQESDVASENHKGAASGCCGCTGACCFSNRDAGTEQ